MTKLVLRALLAAWVLGVTSIACADTDTAWIESHMRHWRVPGVVVVIVRSGQPPVFHSAGLCDVERQVPCTPDLPFHIGSSTKFVTGLLAAALAAEKKISLDEPIHNRWPEFRLGDKRWADVTLRDLLSQRTGIGSIDWPYFWDNTQTRKDYLNRVAAFPMAKPFRTAWSYANANYVLAGAYLERTQGSSWESLVRDRLLLPLQMRDSGFASPAGKTTGYALDAQGRWVPMPFITSDAVSPAGGLVTTARDYAKFVQMVLDNGSWQGRQLVPTAAVSEATSAVARLGYDRRAYGPPGGYGFGIFLATYRKSAILQHSGGYGGYSAHFALLPHEKLGVIVLTNRTNSSFPHALSLGLIDRTLGLSGEESLARWWVEPATLDQTAKAGTSSSSGPPRPLREYEGAFGNPAWGEFRIYLSGGKLGIHYGPFAASLDHSREDEFSFESAPEWERLKVRFEVDAAGAVGGFSLQDEDNAQPQRFVRSTAGGTAADGAPASSGR